MSGNKFVEALSRLGYPGSSDIDGCSFDWIFEFDAVVPFLDWFCEEVQADNRLDPKDVNEFLALEQSEGILDGEQLEEVLQGFTDCEEEMSEDQLSQEVEQLEDDLKNYQFRKELLTQQTKRLSQQKSTLVSRLSRLESLESELKTQNMLELDKSGTDNKKMNSALNSVTVGVSKLNKLYAEKKQQTGGVISEPNIAIFLSQIQLDDFFKMEEKFTSELTAFTKKRFFEGIAEMAGASEGSRFELLEISNPEMLTVRGEEEPALQEACKEIARLQSHYPKNKALLVNAMVEEKTTRVACDFTETKIRQLKETHFLRDPPVLSNHLKDAQITLEVVRQHLMALSEDEIPSLIKDYAKLQVACILCGNYDLKIARQNYFMDNQDQIIEQLLIQKARYEFLTMAFELESRAHRNTSRLLTALRMSLQDMARLQKERMQMLKDPLLSTNLNERSTLDSRDKFFARLHHLLNVGEFASQPQLFITYQQLVANSEKLKNNLVALKDSCSVGNSSQDDIFHTLEKSLKSCEVTLYSGSSTAGIKPRLTPQPVKDLIMQLDEMLKTLENTVLSLLKDVKQKKKMLRTDPFLKTERELFVYFFNAPDRLRRVLLDVTNKLEALSV